MASPNSDMRLLGSSEDSAMVQEYNKINPDDDTKTVIDAKIAAIQKAIAAGEADVAELEAEKAKLEAQRNAGE